ncbi:MAG: porin family protein [Prevotella sp.]|nr:porin family protein [Prevotella sp.]
MKKAFTMIALVALTAFSTNAQAQDEVQTKLRFGVKGGLNLTSFTFSEGDFNTENRAGFFIGPSVKFALPLIGLGVDASALYNQKESKIGTVTVKDKSVDIPVNLRYAIGLGSTANVFLAAGPQIAFNLGDKDISLDTAKEWRFKDSYFSFNVGGGVVINKFQIGVNYNIPISKTSDVEWKDATNQIFHADSKAKNWQISLAYYF